MTEMRYELAIERIENIKGEIQSVKNTGIISGHWLILHF